MKPSRSQIVTTIGPATKDLKIVRELIRHQMDVARLNFFWGADEEWLGYINTIRDAEKEAGRHIPIIADLAGPRVQEKDGHKFDAGFSGVLTEKDLRNLDFGLKNDLDYFSLSFVGNGSDIELLRDEMRARGAQKP